MRNQCAFDFSGAEAMACIRAARPDVVMLDYVMPHMDGATTIRALKDSADTRHIAIVMSSGLPEEVVRPRCSGYDAFLQKPFSPQTLLERIREAVQRDQENRRKRSLAHGIQDRIARLTDREREIMDLLASGESTKQIAQRLSISPKTVDNHRAKVLEKMNVDNPTQLAHLLAAL